MRSKKSSKSSSSPVLFVVFGLVIAAAAGAYYLLKEPSADSEGAGSETVVVATDESDDPRMAVETAPVTAAPERLQASETAPLVSDIVDDIDPEAPTGTIMGFVIDSNQRAIEGALVRVTVGSPIANMSLSTVNEYLPVQATSDDQGGFTLAGVPEGKNYLVVAEHEDFAPALVQGQRVKADETLYDVRLIMRVGARVHGHVRTVADNPIGEARVEIYDSVANARLKPAERRPARIVFSDSQGNFEFLNIPYNSFQVRVEALGFENQTIMQSAALRAAPEDVELKFYLSDGRIVSGVVLDTYGKPVEGARIDATALKKDYQGTSFAYSDPGGRFLLEGMSVDHNYQVRCTCPGYSDKIVPSIHVDDGELVIEVEPRLTIEGVVKDTNGSPMPNFTVVLMRSVAGRDPVLQNDVRPFADPEGKFMFDNLEPGFWAFEARHPDYAPTRCEPVEVTRGGATPSVEITMTEGGTLKGIVRNSKGEALKNAVVKINQNEFVDSPILKIFNTMSPSAERKLKMRTNDAGRFQFKHVTPGTYQVAVTHHDYAPYVENDITVVEGTVTESTISMPVPASLSGVAYDENRRAMGFLRVQISRGNGYVESVTTDANGNFQFDNLTAGDYLLTLFPDTRDGQPINPLVKLVYAQQSRKEVQLSEGEQRSGIEMYLKENN